MDRFNVPSSNRDADICFKGALAELKELMEEISTNELATVSQVKGAIHNRIEILEGLL